MPRVCGIVSWQTCLPVQIRQSTLCPPSRTRPRTQATRLPISASFTASTMLARDMPLCACLGQGAGCESATEFALQLGERRLVTLGRRDQRQAHGCRTWCPLIGYTGRLVKRREGIPLRLVSPWFHHLQPFNHPRPNRTVSTTPDSICRRYPDRLELWLASKIRAYTPSSPDPRQSAWLG